MSAAPIKVLVIDDEPPIRKLLRMGLSTQGYEILEASNGKIALELLAQDPALITLDLGLPDIQGHDLLRMIRGRNDSEQYALYVCLSYLSVLLPAEEARSRFHRSTNASQQRRIALRREEMNDIG